MYMKHSHPIALSIHNILLLISLIYFHFQRRVSRTQPLDLVWCLACCAWSSPNGFGINVGLEIRELLAWNHSRWSFPGDWSASPKGIISVSIHKELDHKRSSWRTEGNATCHCRRITPTSRLCRWICWQEEYLQILVIYGPWCKRTILPWLAWQTVGSSCALL